MLTSHNLQIVPRHEPADHPDLLSLFCKQPVETAEAGQTIFFEGDIARHLFALMEGDVRVCRLLPDGRRVITGFLRAGDVVGISFKNRYLYSAEAINRVSFRRMTKRAFEEELCSTPFLRPHLLSHLCDEAAAAQDHMVLLTCKSAEERVCTFLLRQLRHEQGRGGSRDLIKLAMIRLDIADHLGLTIETVSRTLTKLVCKGVVVPVGRHTLRVLSETALAHLAGDGKDYEFDECDVPASGRQQRQWA